MGRRGENTALRGLLDEAEMSNIALGRAVVAVGAREGIHLGTNTTSVRRMLDGAQPHWPVPRLVAGVLAGRLPITSFMTERLWRIEARVTVPAQGRSSAASRRPRTEMRSF